MIMNRTDKVFISPELVVLDARPSVQDVMPTETDEGRGARLRCDLQLMGSAEERTEVGAVSTELLCQCCRHVDLQKPSMKPSLHNEKLRTSDQTEANSGSHTSNSSQE